MTDPDLRWSRYAEAEKLIVSDAPWIFLWFPVRYEAVSPRIKNYRIPVIFNGQKYTGIRFE
jgi:ABC-type transport system substrate-binding protein